MATMLFNSISFLLWFLPITVALYALVSQRRRNGVLLIASYVFYGLWNPLYCGLLLLSTSVDYATGKRIASTENTRKRTLFLAASLSVNLGLLGFFKYYGMVADTVNSLSSVTIVPDWNILLPVGISFYTFQSISYSIDIFRREASPAKSFTDFACYVSLFPQLVAGPIVRWHEIDAQLRSRTHSYDRIAEGTYRFILGLSKKVLLADSFAVFADGAFAAETLNGSQAWIGLLAYALQIYFDFAGYSDMAIGLGLCFGFRFPENFDRPYASKSITEFWQRWHMTLGAWFRDYLYIPLGGNRYGKLLTVRNLIMTMFLAGLWHGAAWTFVAWGLYYGVLLAIERLTWKRRKVIPGSLRFLVTFTLVTLAWVLFRSPTFGDAAAYYEALFIGPWSGGDAAAATIVAISLLLLPLERFVPKAPKKYGVGLILLCCALMIINMIVIAGNEASPFLYFQF